MVAYTFSWIPILDIPKARVVQVYHVNVRSRKKEFTIFKNILKNSASKAKNFFGFKLSLKLD